MAENGLFAECVDLQVPSQVEGPTHSCQYEGFRPWVKLSVTILPISRVINR